MAAPTLTRQEWYAQFLQDLLEIQKKKQGSLELQDYLDAAKGEN